eukprot:TRINITY_DN56098_c0_g1_i1.p1 TRINITY_DN56098_c0_g1~~TRINITY_DN56098_c0_g1_i1.p1  ORF type:complete len:560 (+),score=45.52 TRINITY_DN56098_c0_g1_i1:339-2018(+)
MSSCRLHVRHLEGQWTDSNRNFYEVTLEPCGTACTVRRFRWLGRWYAAPETLQRRICQKRTWDGEDYITFGEEYILPPQSNPSLLFWQFNAFLTMDPRYGRVDPDMHWSRYSSGPGKELSCEDSMDALERFNRQYLATGASSSSCAADPSLTDSRVYSEAQRRPALWEYEGDFADSWKSFDPRHCRQLDEQWHRYKEEQENPQDGGGKLVVERGKFYYEIDFARMVQTNLSTNRERGVRRNGESSGQSGPVASPAFAAKKKGAKRWVSSHNAAEYQAERAVQDTSPEFEVARLQEKVAELEQRLQRQAVDRSDAVQMWRHLDADSSYAVRVKLFETPERRQPMQDLLHSCIPHSHASRCASARSVVVDEVLEVCNPELFLRYKLRRHEIERSIQHHTECPWVDTDFPELDFLIQSLGLHREGRSNEAFVFHGTKASNVDGITKEGFIHQLSDRNLYGKGVYFAADFCKAMQYAKEADSNGRLCVIIARVVLGHPYMARGSMNNQRPPLVENRDTRHHSTIAKRGIPNDPRNKASRQKHIEFVIPDGVQAYPELIVWFRS